MRFVASVKPNISFVAIVDVVVIKTIKEYQQPVIPGNTYSSNAALHIETSYLICFANQMTDFYRKCNTRLTWVKLGIKNTIHIQYSKSMCGVTLTMLYNYCLLSYEDVCCVHHHSACS